MKIEQLLVQYFYSHREVTLQGMGTFTLSPDFVPPMENDKDQVMPENAISFQYNARAGEDEGLINYIVQQTRKMKALASADLDSYLVLGKQFLNIGKPFKIEGLGLLVKNQQGEYQFTQGQSFHTKIEEIPATLKEKLEEDEISFASETKHSSGTGRKGLLIGVFIIGMGLIGATAWYFLKGNKKNTGQVAAVQQVVKPDTNKSVTVIPDSSLIKKDSSASVVNDGYTFKVVFTVTTNKAYAIQRMNTLTTRGHKVIMYTDDSIRYKLAEPFTLPLSDTTHIKDSLNLFYYLGSAFIELK